MSSAHVCDECKTVAPIGEAIGWWKQEIIEPVLLVGEKGEYHFCSWQCLADYSRRHVGDVRRAMA